MMVANKQNSEHYLWGEKCSGWHLVKSNNLSIIQELMPPGTGEKLHYHESSQQFFHILSGEATFQIEGESVVIRQGEGLHIHPLTKHLVSNQASRTLEFILISQPTAKNDRIEAPFPEASSLNLHDKRFKSIDTSANGQVSTETTFHYRQNKNIVWATYEGGDIVFGTLSGSIIANKLEFTYQHQDLSGDFMTGKCTSILDISNGKLRLKEKWQWTCIDYGVGESMLEEV